MARNPLLGNALAIAAAGAVSAYFICGQAAQKAGLAIHHYALVAYATAALVLLPLPPLLGFAYTGWPLKLYGAILLLALIPQLVGHTSLNWGRALALPHMGHPSGVGRTHCCEPLCLAALW